MAKDFDNYQDAIDNPIRTPGHDRWCVPATSLDLNKEVILSDPSRLPEPEPGFVWYYFEDRMFLSGGDHWVELNFEKKQVGRLIGISMS